jgi:hypothetical protein
VTTWDANAALFLSLFFFFFFSHGMLMIWTLSFAVHVEPMIFLEKSAVQHCCHLSHVFCVCSLILEWNLLLETS